MKLFVAREPVKSSHGFLFAIVLLSLHAGSARGDTDYRFVEQSADNSTLVVFVAGLLGKESWSSFTPLIESDAGIPDINFLIYHSPQSRNINENIDRLSTLVGEFQPDTERLIIVGHSIGGIMIKEALLLQIDRDPAARLPDMVMTFGTPFDVDKFETRLYERLGARLFGIGLTQLQRDATNFDRIRDINQRWREALKNNPLKDVRHINIFGLGDSRAPPEEEQSSPDTVFIIGDHKEIVKPRTSGDCSWVIFKTMVENPVANPREVDCDLPEQ